MNGLRRRIETIIEEVNHEIRVNLGLKESLPELKTPDTLGMVDELPEMEETDTESEEAKAFEKILDEICQRYENERVEDEPDELGDWEKALLDEYG